ncbi:MAG: hypothetical protein WAS33_27130, partial [Candidatus Promineifilaceae bacterium]
QPRRHLLHLETAVSPSVLGLFLGTVYERQTKQPTKGNYMSWQAQTAVTLHSNQTSIKRLRLLLFLANGADAAGLIDPAPSQETLAEFLGCTTRTVRTYLAQIEADGELKQTRVGSGPGNASAYQITLPMPENGRSDPENNTGKAENEGGKVEGNPGNISTIDALKVEIKVEIFELKAEINQLKVEILRLKGGKVEGERWKGHSFKNADDPSLIHFDPSLIQEEGEAPLPPNLPGPFSFRPSPKSDLPEHESPADKRLGAVIQVCGLSNDVPAHVNQAANAAVQLKDFSAGWILDRYGLDPPPDGGWHWYSDDWRGQRGDMPTATQVVETIAKRKTAVQPKQNGRSHSRSEQVAAEYAAMKQEFFSHEHE